MDRVAAACDYLLDLRRTKRRVAALPEDVVPRSLDEGYAVQEKVVSALLDHRGGKPIGYKVACTSKLAQKALGVDGPFFGTLLSSTTYPSGTTTRRANGEASLWPSERLCRIVSCRRRNMCGCTAKREFPGMTWS